MSTYPHLVSYPILESDGMAITSDRIRNFEPTNPREPNDRGRYGRRRCSVAILKTGNKIVVAGTADDNRQQLMDWERAVGL